MMGFTTLQRGEHFVEADRAVAILVHLAEDAVCLSGIGSAGAERVLEFRFAELAVAVGVDLSEQVLEKVGFAGRRGGRAARGMALRRQQCAHGGRRYLRMAAATGRRWCAWSGRAGAGEIERVARILAGG